MLRIGITYLFIFCSAYLCAQQTPSHCNDPAFNKKVDKSIIYSVPVLDVDDLKNNLDEYLILDAREEKEFETSHIPGAHLVGYNHLDLGSLEGISKDTKIVVYCSIGYRSEKVGEKLSALGFRKVYNLYGSIFEWANRNYPLENINDLNTKEVHTYSKKWSQWLTNPDRIKVW